MPMSTAPISSNPYKQSELRMTMPRETIDTSCAPSQVAVDVEFEITLNESLCTVPFRVSPRGAFPSGRYGGSKEKRVRARERRVLPFSELILGRRAVRHGLLHRRHKVGALDAKLVVIRKAQRLRLDVVPAEQQQVDGGAGLALLALNLHGHRVFRHEACVQRLVRDHCDELRAGRAAHGVLRHKRLDHSGDVVAGVEQQLLPRALDVHREAQRRHHALHGGARLDAALQLRDLVVRQAVRLAPRRHGLPHAVALKQEQVIGLAALQLHRHRQLGHQAARLRLAHDLLLQDGAVLRAQVQLGLHVLHHCRDVVALEEVERDELVARLHLQLHHWQQPALAGLGVDQLDQGVLVLVRPALRQRASGEAGQEALDRLQLGVALEDLHRQVLSGDLYRHLQEGQQPQVVRLARGLLQQQPPRLRKLLLAHCHAAQKLVYRALDVLAVVNLHHVLCGVLSARVVVVERDRDGHADHGQQALAHRHEGHLPQQVASVLLGEAARLGEAHAHLGDVVAHVGSHLQLLAAQRDVEHNGGLQARAAPLRHRRLHKAGDDVLRQRRGARGRLGLRAHRVALVDGHRQRHRAPGRAVRARRLRHVDAQHHQRHQPRALGQVHGMLQQPRLRVLGQPVRGGKSGHHRVGVVPLKQLEHDALVLLLVVAGEHGKLQRGQDARLRALLHRGRQHGGCHLLRQLVLRRKLLHRLRHVLLCPGQKGVRHRRAARCRGEGDCDVGVGQEALLHPAPHRLARHERRLLGGQPVRRGIARHRRVKHLLLVQLERGQRVVHPRDLELHQRVQRVHAAAEQDLLGQGGDLPGEQAVLLREGRHHRLNLVAVEHLQADHLARVPDRDLQRQHRYDAVALQLLEDGGHQLLPQRLLRHALRVGGAQHDVAHAVALENLERGDAAAAR
mmetsp:Transcript_41142/g.104259  ORF Transcript_41142/g.104259 Transcript_41142/m.104259 type:complete len:905 (-) Transcript_41142:12-2726(-)